VEDDNKPKVESCLLVFIARPYGLLASHMMKKCQAIKRNWAWPSFGQENKLSYPFQNYHFSNKYLSVQSELKKLNT
jgi:hypothetical protein